MLPPLAACTIGAGARQVVEYVQNSGAELTRGKGQTMRRCAVLWTTLILGGLLWLSSIGVWSNAAYRLILMFTILVWSAWIVRTPKPT